MTARFHGVLPNPSGLCGCGCGQITAVYKQGDRKRGFVKGEHQCFVRGHSTHPKAIKGPYKQVRDKYEHVAIAEAALGKPLPNGAEVHHVDGNGRNNSHSNLVICQDRAYHKLLHKRARVIAFGGNPNTDRICAKCSRALPFDRFHKSTRAGLQSRCKGCVSAVAA